MEQAQLVSSADPNHKSTSQSMQDGRFTKIRKFLRISAIVWLSISTLLELLLIFGGGSDGDDTISSTMSTAGILGLLSVFSLNNIIRIEKGNRAVKVASIIALIANCVWGLLCLGLIWHIFDFSGCEGHYLSNGPNECDGYFVFISLIQRTIFTAITIACVFTLISNYLNYQVRTKLVLGFITLTIICASVLGVLVILAILDEKFEIFEFWQFLLALIVLLLFGLIITPIAVRAQHQQEATDEQTSLPTSRRTSTACANRSGNARSSRARNSCPNYSRDASYSHSSRKPDR